MVESAIHVLSIGVGDFTMKTRTLILEKAGFKVLEVSDLRRVESACAETSFSVAVLGQAINPNEKRRIADVVLKYCSEAKILDLHTGLMPELPEADAHMQLNTVQPLGLVERVAELAQQRGKSKASRAV